MHYIIRFISFFIPNKKKRRAFREQCSLNYIVIPKIHKMINKKIKPTDETICKIHMITFREFFPNGGAGGRGRSLVSE